MKNSLLQETLELRRRYDEEPSHSDHVAELALQIFDSLRGPLKLEERARDLLHSAALLHDIGWSQVADGRGHHKQSARLIGEHAWQSLAQDEIPLVAQIARYHRKSLPRPAHHAYHELPGRAKKQVLLLGGILRVADALDRTHSARISRATAKIAGHKVTIQVEPRPGGNWEAERGTFEAKRDLLELALGKFVRCEG